MMETTSISETSVNFYQTTRRNNPEDSHLHSRRRENLKSHLQNSFAADAENVHHLLEDKQPPTRNFVTSRHIVVLFSTFLSVENDFFENENILLVNTPYSHLRSFCTTGVSSGLATG
jgi:hypothetical protein